MKQTLRLLFVAVLITASASVRAAVPAIATDKIHDMTATMRVTDANFDELKKIGGDFATSYRFKRMEISYKTPNRTRLEANVLGTSVLLIYNGSTKTVKVPFKKDVKDVSDSPGQKTSLMQFGVFSRDWLETDYEATLLRTEKGLQVYKLAQRNTDNKSHEVVWVNPKTALITRRQSFNGEGKLRMETRHTNVEQVRKGIWLPTRIEVYNQFGKLGGVQIFENVKVNLGVADSRFTVS